MTLPLEQATTSIAAVAPSADNPSRPDGATGGARLPRRRSLSGVRQGAVDGALQALESGGAGRLAARDQNGLGVGGAQQPPAVGGLHADAVDLVEGRALLAKAGLDRLDDGEFFRIGARK